MGQLECQRLTLTLELLPSDLARLLRLEEHQLWGQPARHHDKPGSSSTRCSLEGIAPSTGSPGELAKLFGVRGTEVGILRFEGELLRFLHPAELQSAGVHSYLGFRRCCQNSGNQKGGAVQQLCVRCPTVPSSS